MQADFVEISRIFFWSLRLFGMSNIDSVDARSRHPTMESQLVEDTYNCRMTLSIEASIDLCLTISYIDMELLSMIRAKETEVICRHPVPF